jgi:RND superfamily putative drug exporter
MGAKKRRELRRNATWLRTVLASIIVLVWVVMGGIGGPYFGKISEVSSNDLTTFLPKSAESTKVKTILEKYQSSSTIPAIIVFESSSTLTDGQKAEIDEARSTLAQSETVAGELNPVITSDDGKAAFLLVPLDAEAKIAPLIDSLKETLSSRELTMQYGLTGPAMFSRDLSSAFEGIDGTLLIVALSVVFIILLIVYRSPVLPFLTLIGAMLALATAIFVVWHLANAGILQLNGQVQGILFILVIGAATDYSLLYIARFREELTHYSDKWVATKAAWKGAWEPVAAAGGTVALGLLCLLLSDLGSNKALGPVGSVGVILSILAALTFLPASLLLFGRSAFWPRRPEFQPRASLDDYKATHPFWAKVGTFVGKYPRRIWVATSLLLVVACFFVPQLKAQGVSQQDLIIGKSEARDGQAMLNRHFSSGSGSPTYVVVDSTQQQEVLSLLEADTGVDSVSAISDSADRPSLPLGTAKQKIETSIRNKLVAGRDAQVAALKAQLITEMAGAPEQVIEAAYNAAVSQIPSVDQLAAGVDPFAGINEKVIDNQVVLQVTLKDPASSVAARDTVKRLRSTVQAASSGALFGGVSAIQLDTNIAAEHDLRVIIPAILIAITIVLMLLLRSIVAPLVLLLTTVVSFGATLGISALLFNNVWGYAGADPSVVIFGFVFLVALGIDYNIFLMTRVREETMRLGIRAGTLKALAVTGGVITSAGIVLASTFAALYVIPILFLAQIAFIVAFGVLLDTLIVRSLLVPALTLEIGRSMWWPARWWRNGKR